MTDFEGEVAKLTVTADDIVIIRIPNDKLTSDIARHIRQTMQHLGIKRYVVAPNEINLFSMPLDRFNELRAKDDTIPSDLEPT